MGWRKKKTCRNENCECAMIVPTASFLSAFFDKKVSIYYSGIFSFRPNSNSPLLPIIITFRRYFHRTLVKRLKGPALEFLSFCDSFSNFLIFRKSVSECFEE